MTSVFIYGPPVVLVLLLGIGVRNTLERRVGHPALTAIALFCGLLIMFIVTLACNEGTGANEEPCATTKPIIDPLVLGYLGLVIGSWVLSLIAAVTSVATRNRLMNLSFWTAVATPLLFVLFELTFLAAR